jgi:hypothetical protein
MLVFFRKNMMYEEPQFNQFEEDPFLDYELENEMLLMKLQAEFGGRPEFFAEEDSEELTAPLKYEFLKSIYSFEQNFHLEQLNISLFEHLGEPYLVDQKYLTDDGIRCQLQRIRSLMKEKQFMLDTIYDTDDRVVYQFVLEELLQEKVEETLPPGFFRHFIYEEFHPNHHRDIEEQIIQFFQHISEQAIPSSCFYLCDEIVVGDILFTREEAINRLMLFAGLFASLEVTKLEFTSIAINDESAAVTFRICYNGLVSDNETIKVDQSGHLGLIFKDQLIWQIDSLDIPGVVF